MIVRGPEFIIRSSKALVLKQQKYGFGDLGVEVFAIDANDYPTLEPVPKTRSTKTLI